MPRKVLLISMLVVCLGAFGQTSADSSNSQPAIPSQTETPTSPNTIGTTYPAQSFPLGNGLGWSGGTVGYYGEGPAGGALLSTPTASFDSPPPTAGISMAGRAGISDSSPVSSVLQSSATTSTLVYTNIAPEIAAGVSPATSAVSSVKPAYDLGPSFFSNQIGQNGGIPSGITLAQVADRYRAMATTASLRTYTNADVRPARTTAEAENALLASNKPPVFPQAMATTPRPSASTAVPVETAQNSQNQAPVGRQNELPASASPLPLLGLMGLISLGLGMVLWGSSHRATPFPRRASSR